MTKEYRGEDETGSPDGKGAVESDVRRIETIKGNEVLGYDKVGREEHSGQNAPEPGSGLETADNDPAQRPKDQGKR